MTLAQAKFQPHILALLLGVMFISMLIPSLYAARLGDFGTAQIFLYTALLGLTCLTVVTIAISNQTFALNASGQISLMILLYLLFPCILAIPVYGVVGTTHYINAYLEMVSAFSTTGLPVIETGRMTPILGLWRAIVSWFGAGLIFCAALTILRPVYAISFARGYAHSDLPMAGQRGQKKYSPFDQFAQELRYFVPLYALLTAVAALLYWGIGANIKDAIIGALQVLSTTGYVFEHSGNSFGRQGGVFEYEIVTALFLILALSRVNISQFYTSKTGHVLNKRMAENQFAIGLLLFLTLVLSLRHFWGTYTVHDTFPYSQSLGIIWGNLYTLLSFQTTYGLASQAVDFGPMLSGLNRVELVLIGVALIGGGVATTAGGIKLYRIISLLSYTRAEVSEMITPSEVSASNQTRVQNHAARSTLGAWVYFMLFVIVLALTIAVFAVAGLEFETGIILSVASLSNTGAIAHILPDHAVSIIHTSTIVKLILAVNMVLGRLEVLALVVIFNTRNV